MTSKKHKSKPASTANTDREKKISPPSATNTQRRAERILPISAQNGKDLVVTRNLKDVKEIPDELLQKYKLGRYRWRRRKEN